MMKYLSCGRNIVQQEADFRKGQWNYGVVTPISVPTTLNLTDDLAGIATGELIGVSQLSKEAGNEM
jgi:hypothetical protein